MAAGPRVGREVSGGSGNPGDEATFGYGAGAQEDRSENALFLKMINDLISDVGGLKATVLALKDASNGNDRRLADIERGWQGIASKIDNVHAFSTHTAPHLATKEDLANLKSELKDAISERPKLATIFTIIGLALMALAIPFFPDWWTHVKHLFLQ